MARIRTIKPEFWTDEDMAELSEPACLLAIGLLNYADDEGYFNANPKLIKAAIFPIREPSVPIPVLIRELSNCGYLSMFYTADGKQFGAITNFLKHQVVNKPKESKIKCLPLIPYESGTDTGQVHVGMDQGSGKGKVNPSHNAREENLPSPPLISGGNPEGKFAMFYGWQPDPDLVRRAAIWGINLISPPQETEIAEFVTYWQAEGKFFAQIQWEQKLARRLQISRQNKLTQPEEGVPHWNSPESWEEFI